MSKHRDVMASELLAGNDEEPESPMNGLGNLADCMLVLVCGLMVAFFAHYNVFDSATKVEPTGEKTQVQQELSSAGASSKGKSDSTYKKLGTLYQDAKTGDMYYFDDGEDSSNGD